MKKFIAVLLSVLMIFSAFGMTFALAADESDAGDEVYTVVFKDYDGRVISSTEYAAGQAVEVPENPEREATEEYTYIFKGWASDSSSELVHKNTVPNVTADATYTAVYSEFDNVKTPTFWNLVQSIFARLNAILDYITRIFTKK